MSSQESRRRVLLLAFAFPPENLTGAARPWRFYRYLPEFGYDPVVVTASTQDAQNPHPHVTGVEDRTRATRRRSFRRLFEAAIYRIFRPGDEGFLWMFDAFRVAGRLLAKRDRGTSTPSVSAIYSTFPSLNVHLVAMALKRRYGLPWIADFRDPLVGNSFTRHTALSNKVDEFLERRIFEEADALTVVSDAIADQWRGRYPAQAHKIHVLCNGYDPARPIVPLPIPKRPYRVLAHLGSFYGGRTPEPLVASVLRLIDAGRLDPAAIRVVFVGEFVVDSYPAETRALLDRLSGLGCLQYEDRIVPREEALNVMAMSDYLLLADNNRFREGHTFTIPAKIFEYVQVGRPILALTEKNSPVDRVLERSGVPVTVIEARLPDPEVDQRLYEFLQLRSDPVEPSAWFRDTFDGRRQTGTLAGILDSIIGSDIEPARR